MLIKPNVNRVDYEVEIDCTLTLADFLRSIGVSISEKYSSGEECGGSVVLLDGLLVNPFLVLAAEANNSAILTAEGLEDDEKFFAIRELLARKKVKLCEFCLSGLMIAIKYFLDAHSFFLKKELAYALESNFCPSTDNDKVIEAIMEFSGTILV